MNLTQVMSMSDEELRIEIAKMHGYKLDKYYSQEVFDRWPGLGFEKYIAVYSPDYKSGGKLVAMGRANVSDENKAWKLATENPYFPNWPASISDAYSLEGEIPEEKQIIYIDYLRKVLLQTDKIYRDGSGVTEYDFTHATASQRARAWLLTMGDE